jgi:hypothetical protein
MTGPEGLQQALAAEHAAVFGYGVVGAQLRGTARAEARAAYDAHLARRDRLTALLADAGQTPVAAAPAYDLPRRVATADQARALAVELEEGVAVTYADVVAATTATERALAATALQEAAVRAARWRRRSVAFPGLPERR